MDWKDRRDRTGIAIAKSAFVCWSTAEGTVGLVAVVVLAVRVGHR
jgi:hypothetical protein